ncbi:toll/interleukin-1 receptor domain-containing protein [Dictyobacter aurantiacus]|uniref:TIR domain-containing protein n=1 Tax=Dictyobacter aurantiacus TaxID=1936993 RepID=A0A401ZRI2_9CHLR|nr:toll/interleukin-1 receptor domain-containing protein [Dictyobacter aurantiacus]GCE09479.1 hypothetical protein KDAU_68080 [Dictyobacter aurantiacus]
MANPEHVKLLKQGVEIWNQWRTEHRDARPDFSGADLHDSDLQGVYFNGAVLSHTNMSGANLHKAVLVSAHLTQANLNQAQLCKASLSGANLSGARLCEADLSEADLFQVNLHRADLSGTRLDGAYFYQANLSKVNLTNADMKGAQLGLTVFADVNLCHVQGLEFAVHRCKSYLNLDVIMRFHNNLPIQFLQGVGFSNSIINGIRSGNIIPIDDSAQSHHKWEACFISYTQQDQAFAKKLHQDLQRQGIRCWLDDEDRLDDELRFSIPHIIILSQHSVQLDWRNSQKPDWVFQEVIDALATEKEQERHILIPIRLDETIWQLNEDWAEELRQTREIDDFTHWSNEEIYQQALNRLLCRFKTGR